LRVIRESLKSQTLGGLVLLVNPQNPIAEPNVRDAKEAAQILGLQLRVLNASTEAEIDLAFDALGQGLAGALLVQPDAFLNNRRIVALAARYAMPTMYQVRDLTAAGGLISHGPNLADLYRQMGVYTGKVVKGTHPAELPVLQPTRFELIINLKTAKTLGMEIPANLLALANEVIECDASSYRFSAARRSRGRSRRAHSRASACGAIGVLMPHAQDNRVGPPRIAALL
jgi:putative ABC transport system substrate-binding protein